MLETSTAQRPGRVESITLTVLFAVLFASPLTVWAVRGIPDNSATKEERVAAAAPTLPTNLDTLRAWPDATGAWFSDRYPARGELLHLRGRLLYDIFGVSPVAAMRAGKDNWFFYTGQNSFEFYRGADLFEPEELDAWVKRFHAWRDWLAARDVDFLLITPPDKHRVYSEFLPDNTEPVGERTRLHQFLEALAERTPVEFIDPNAAIFAAKPWGLLYFPLGVHWNDRGAFVAYTQAFEQLAAKYEGLAPHPIESFHVVDRAAIDPAWTGDSWSGRMHLGERLRQEAVQVVPKFPLPYAIVSFQPNRSGTIDGVTRHIDPSLPRIVLVRDSFGDWFFPFVALHASQLVSEGFIRHPVELVELHRPDLLIHMRLENGLMEVPPDIRISEDEIKLARAWLAAEPLAGGDGAGAAFEPGVPRRFENVAGPRGAVVRVEREPKGGAEVSVRLVLLDGSERTARVPVWDGWRWSFQILEAWEGDADVEIACEGALGIELRLR